MRVGSVLAFHRMPPDSRKLASRVDLDDLRLSIAPNSTTTPTCPGTVAFQERSTSPRPDAASRPESPPECLRASPPSVTASGHGSATPDHGQPSHLRGDVGPDCPPPVAAALTEIGVTQSTRSPTRARHPCRPRPRPRPWGTHRCCGRGGRFTVAHHRHSADERRNRAGIEDVNTTGAAQAAMSLNGSRPRSGQTSTTIRSWVNRCTATPTRRLPGTMVAIGGGGSGQFCGTLLAAEVLVCDIRLPDLDGEQLFRRALSTGSNARERIFTTASAGASTTDAGGGR